MTSTIIFYGLLIGVLPSFIWLFFWIAEDKLHPEPRTILAGCFLGGTVAVILAIFAEKYIATIVNDIQWRYVIWAIIEEVTKIIVVSIVALRSVSNDEPIDAMIYCITVALGFAALENMLFVLGPLSDGHVTSTIMISSMRFIGATLVHTVSSAFIGFALGLVFYKKSILIKILAATFGLIIASALHAGFNLSIINASANDTLRIFSWVWGATIILIILFEELKAVRPPRTMRTANIK